MKKIIIFCLFFILLSSASAVIHPRVLDEINNNGHADVILEKKSYPLKVSSLSSPLENQNFQDKELSSRVIDDESLSFLQRNYHIYYNYPVSINLEDVVGLVNAKKTWSLNHEGIFLNGKGQSICIIDTGVDYNHPDLGGCYGKNNPNSSCKIIGGYDFVNNDEDPLDDNGHGTHIAGIASANGIIQGVAPESKIVAVKILDSSGAGDSIGVEKGIKWCLNNSEFFNIKVISLSLGTDCKSGNCFSDYCDDSVPYISELVDIAFEKNISIVVASGNDGNYTSISAPACVKKVIAVGSANKNKEISSSSNRNNLTLLLGIGEGVFSTYLNKNYIKYSGTSMAVPEISGAIAILSQYNSNKNPSDMEKILFKKGSKIFDPISNLNYSLINIYDAINSLFAPVVNLEDLNNLELIERNITLFCNSSDTSNYSLSLKVFDYEGNLFFEDSKENLSGDDFISSNVTNLNAGKYFWNCYALDIDNNSGKYKKDYEFSIKNFLIDLKEVSLVKQEKNFQCNAISFFNMTSAKLTILNSSSVAYTKSFNLSGKNNSLEFSYNFTFPGEYILSCEFFSSNLSEKVEKNVSISPIIFVSLIPKNQTYINIISHLNCEFESLYELKSVKISLLNNSRSLIFEKSENISGYFNSTQAEYSLNNSGEYKVSCEILNSIGQYTEENNFVYDLISPNLSILKLSSESTTEKQIEISFNLTDNLKEGYCELKEKNETYYSGFSRKLNLSLSEGFHNLSLICFDAAGNNVSLPLEINVFKDNTNSDISVSSGNIEKSSSSGGSRTASIIQSKISNQSQEIKFQNISQIEIPLEDKPTEKLSNNYSNNVTKNAHITGAIIGALSEPKAIYGLVALFSLILLNILLSIYLKRSPRK